MSWTMCRGVQNCPFWPAFATFAQHVLVHVAADAHRVEGYALKRVDNLCEQSRCGDAEARVSEVPEELRVFVAVGAEQGENLVADRGEHVLRRLVQQA
ncbi:hypothetical protein [Streptomyces clavifer]|uniref:hypothetical protein n=1 Tax=Streptomyces clavifer TaxID=68188 RepID=UPI0037FA0EC5